jgi:hypothetical protein
VLRAELAVVREHHNSGRLHAGIGYVTPNDQHQGRGAAIRKARQAGLEQAGCGASPTIAPIPSLTRPSTPSTTCPRSPAMLANRSGICIANSETRHVTVTVPSGASC